MVRCLDHEERRGHTYYRITCKLNIFLGENGNAGDRQTKWSVGKRLVELREDLHDVVKDWLHRDYEPMFSRTPFARTGGVPGTTARLDAWLKTLCKWQNQGIFVPAVLAHILRFLEAPYPGDEPLGEKAAAAGRRGAPVAQQASPKSPRSCGGSPGSRPSPDDGLVVVGCDEEDGSEDEKVDREPLAIRFLRSDESEQEVDFGLASPPMGLDLSRTSPLVVTRVQGLAASLGVLPGWEMLSINGVAVDDWSPTQAFDLLHAIVDGVPAADFEPCESRSDDASESEYEDDEEEEQQEGSEESDSEGASDGEDVSDTEEQRRAESEPKRLSVVEEGDEDEDNTVGHRNHIRSPGVRKVAFKVPDDDEEAATKADEDDDEDVEDNDVEASHAGVKHDFAPPSREEAQEITSLEVDFRLPDGSRKSIDFSGQRVPLGLSLDSRAGAAKVRAAQKGSAAERCGVEAGWTLTAVNGRDVSELDDVLKVAKLLRQGVIGGNDSSGSNSSSCQADD